MEAVRAESPDTKARREYPTLLHIRSLSLILVLLGVLLFLLAIWR
jgi:hypothetical protein